MEQILRQFSKAICSTINNTGARCEFVPRALQDLIELKTRPMCLTEIAYDWCSVMCENRQNLEGWEGLLLACLEIGFRHLDLQDMETVPTLTHIEHHPEMVDVVFKSQKSEAIADLLHAWTIGRSPNILLGACTERLLYLHNLVPFSPRLRSLVMRSVEILGCGRFVELGAGKFVELLDHLHVTAEDMDFRTDWLTLLLDTLQTPEGAQRLSHRYWELVVELAVLQSPRLVSTYNPRISKSLTEAQEWSKLERWIGTVWILWPPEADGITEEDLGHSIPMLFRKRPGAFQKLQQWMERWSQMNDKSIPESFQ